MSECIFCKIVAGEIPAVKIYEDDEFIAILDVSPNTEGMTLVMPKEHYSSYVFEMQDEFYKKFMLTVKRIARLIDKNLGVRRTAMVMEGMGVDHAHIKLYPLHGLDEKFQEMLPRETVFFDKYKGYITTQLGPKTDIKKLEQIAKKIRGEEK